MRTSGGTLLTLLLAAGAAACEAGGDSVAPGYYGPTEAASCLDPQAGATGTVSAGASGTTGAAGSPNAGHAAPAGTGGASGGAGSPAAGATSGAGAGSTTMDPPAGGDGARCDLSGRWLVTMHLVSDALGELQYGHYFHYFEIEQDGDAFAITRGLVCGFDSLGVGDFASTADFSAAWPGVTQHVDYDGWSGTSVAGAGGCKVDLPKRYSVRGATVAYYSDPSTTLPTADERAAGATPGWGTGTATATPASPAPSPASSPARSSSRRACGRRSPARPATWARCSRCPCSGTRSPT
jgi:hypothetical protein